MIHTPNALPRYLRADDSYVFLMKELEKTDDTILEPLSGTDWPRDMPVITGGGLAESIATIDVTYGSSGGEDDGLFFETATDIPIIQADMSRSVARTFNFAEYLSFSAMERDKMTQVGRDPETFLNKGIRLHCDKVIDRNVYWGFAKVRSTGLCNNADITRSSALQTSGGSTKWEDKTADQILQDVNKILADTWAANDCSTDALPNHILIPAVQFGMLVTRKVAEGSEKSILTYVLENNLTTQQGGHLMIAPCKWCLGIGSNYSDRMIAYMNQQDRICFNLTQPLKRMETEYSMPEQEIPEIRIPDMSDVMVRLNALNGRAIEALEGLPGLLSASQAVMTQNSVIRNESKSVEAPVNIHVTAAGTDTEMLAQSIYDAAKRHLVRTLRGAMG